MVCWFNLDDCGLYLRIKCSSIFYKRSASFSYIFGLTIVAFNMIHTTFFLDRRVFLLTRLCLWLLLVEKAYSYISNISLRYLVS